MRSYSTIPSHLFAGVVAIILLPFTTKLSAQTHHSDDVYIIQQQYPVHPLAERTKRLKDAGKVESPLSFLSGEVSDSFQTLSPTAFRLEDDSVVWLRVSVYAEDPLENWWLLLKRPDRDLPYITAHRYVDVYFVRNGQLAGHERSGIYVPASEKRLSKHNTVSRVPISLPAGTVTDVYLRIENDGPIYTLLELRDPALALPSPIVGPYLDIVSMSYCALIIGIYVLFFFFYTKDYSYLYLFGMLSCLFLHYYILHPYMPLIDWFFPDQPQLIEAAWAVMTIGAFLFFLQFGRTFTSLKEKLPVWDRLMRWSILFLAALLAIRLFILMEFPAWAQQIEIISTLFTFFLPLLIIIRLAFVRDSLVRYFVVGGLWLFVFSLVGVGWQLGLIPFTDRPNPWAVSQVGFMLIYALALAHKIQKSERARSEVEKVKAIDSVKSRFFANISHEFRTPLSLILGPVNQSLESIPASETIEEETEVPVKSKHLKVMQRNALRLQHLVDQILELSKLDQGKMQLQVSPGRLIPFIRAIVFSFESLAERRHIHFRTHFPQESTIAWFDADKLEKIIVNLLSNAFKFTPEHGEVSVEVVLSNPSLKISISDTGSGMQAAETSRIFDRFYQVEGTHDQGTGIGLALVKELVELHRGQISVNSEEGQGTTFKVSLPYREHDFSAAEKVEQNTQETASANNAPWLSPGFQHPSSQQPSDRDLPSLLIIEDNPDLCRYISEQLQNDFEIITAPNGRRGLRLAHDHLPDLVISDIMMPHMNGLELCAVLKTDIRTSHIPVILLTAKASQEDKITGLQTGADDYLSKPFSGRELRIRAQNLIEQRKKLREKFAGELQIRPTKLSVSSIDEQFLREVMDHIEQNMGNEYFTVEDLATAVGFSRSQLHRKLKALTDKTPNQLIRHFRLTRAKELLEQQSATVSEIAFEVGYSNLSYFSKSYREAFGILPSEVSRSN